MIQGRTIEGIVDACVYIACRLQKIPRTLKEIATKSRFTQKEIGRNYRFIIRELDIHLPPIKAISFIPRFAQDLNLNGRVSQRVFRLLNAARNDLVTVGKAPSGVAAAGLYLAPILEGDSRTQSEISNVASVSEVTIRVRYKELVDKLGIALT
jgi:transcription initiation factor TFIIB